MSTTSRRISERTRPSRNSHTPGKDKGGFCVRMSEANLGTSLNPFKGQGLKGNHAAAYKRFWARMYAENGIKKEKVDG